MNNLHIIQNPMAPEAFEQAMQRYYTNGDQLLILNDGLFLLPQIVKQLSANKSSKTLKLVHVLGEQLNARGLNAMSQQKSVVVIDYEKFVSLTASSDKTISW